MIKSWEDFGNGGGVWDHAYSSHNFSQITSWNDSWWLIVDTNFESSWAPVNELNSSLGFNGGNWSIDVFWDDITSVQHRASHIFTMSWVTFGHHWCWFEGWVGDFSYGQLFVISFLGWDDWRVWTQHKMNSWIWDQVGLEFSDINVQSTIESQRGGQRWDNLSNKSVQVGVSRSFNVQLSSANVINGFVIEDNCNISVF